jgi:hypothetical protein
MYVFCQKQRNKNEIQVSRMQYKLVATPCFEVYNIELHFSGSADTKMDKWNTQMSVNTTTEMDEIVFFSSVLIK